MTLTPSHFDRAGYSIHADVLTRAEMVDVIRALEHAELSRTRAGARHVLRVPAVRDLAVDPRMLAIARDYLGGAIVPYRGTLFDKSAASNWLVTWHQDTALPIVERVNNPHCGAASWRCGR